MAAGDNAPTSNYPGPAKAAAFVADWEKWYAAHHAKLDLAKQFAREELGFTILGVTALKANTKNKIYEVGSMGLGWHTPKLPGLGDVDWGAFFSALTDAGYQGAVCIEVEDRAYEGSLAARIRALRQSKRFLEQFV